MIGHALALNNDVQPDANGNLTGDPTEVALFQAAQQAGYQKSALLKKIPRVGEIETTIYAYRHITES